MVKTRACRLEKVQAQQRGEDDAGQSEWGECARRRDDVRGHAPAKGVTKNEMAYASRGDSEHHESRDNYDHHSNLHRCVPHER
jgi:hypothetical protein